MNDSFIIEGKKYISSRRASEISDYSSDYIGQLCRAQKLDCQRVGRAWFITEESINEHKATVFQDEIARNRIENLRGKKLAAALKTEVSAISIPVAEISVSNQVGPGPGRDTKKESVGAASRHVQIPSAIVELKNETVKAEVVAVKIPVEETAKIPVNEREISRKEILSPEPNEFKIENHPTVKISVSENDGKTQSEVETKIAPVVSKESVAVSPQRVETKIEPVVSNKSAVISPHRVETKTIPVSSRESVEVSHEKIETRSEVIVPRQFLLNASTDVRPGDQTAIPPLDWKIVFVSSDYKPLPARSSLPSVAYLSDDRPLLPSLKKLNAIAAAPNRLPTKSTNPKAETLRKLAPTLFVPRIGETKVSAGISDVVRSGPKDVNAPDWKITRPVGALRSTEAHQSVGDASKIEDVVSLKSPLLPMNIGIRQAKGDIKEAKVSASDQVRPVPSVMAPVSAFAGILDRIASTSKVLSPIVAAEAVKSKATVSDSNIASSSKTVVPIRVNVETSEKIASTSKVVVSNISNLVSNQSDYGPARSVGATSQPMGRAELVAAVKKASAVHSTVSISGAGKTSKNISPIIGIQIAARAGLSRNVISTGPTFAKKAENPVLGKIKPTAVAASATSTSLKAVSESSKAVKSTTSISSKNGLHVKSPISMATLARKIILSRALGVTFAVVFFVGMSLLSFKFFSENGSRITANISSASNQAQANVFETVDSTLAYLRNQYRSVIAFFTIRPITITMNQPATIGQPAVSSENTPSTNSADTKNPPPFSKGDSPTGELAVTKPAGDQTISVNGMNGIAIIPSSGSNAADNAVKEKIQNSFSDQVEVNPDKSGTAGVITPVFKDSKGKDFIYVMVPVKETPSASAPSMGSTLSTGSGQAISPQAGSLNSAQSQDKSSGADSSLSSNPYSGPGDAGSPVPSTGEEGDNTPPPGSVVPVQVVP